MSYIGNVPTPAASETRQEFTATASQTTFNTSGYVIGNFISVYLNGVRLSAGTDFTATNGYDVVLTTGAAAGDLLAVEMRNTLADIGAGFASTSEVTGTNTTGSITTGTNSLTVASGTGINVGDYVVGEGIAPGTTVSAISGTSVTLSGTVGATLSSDPVSFYTANKALSPGLVAGQLCRAWVNFDGVNQTIRAAYNVSSIEDRGTGFYRITFATAMPDINYCVQAICGQNRGASTNRSVGLYSTSDTTYESNMATTDFSLAIMNSNAGDQDHDVVCASVFR
jgi:hypothetical protein